MSGLPRSGSTLLTALLNQNPEIYASTNSPLLDTIHYTEEYLLHNSEQYKAHPKPECAHNVLSSIPENYYFNTPQNIIIDKSRGWVNQIGHIQDYITKEPKIICPVRNIVDILTSYDTIINANDNSRSNPMDQRVIATSYPDKPIADRRADFLMAPNQDIYQSINYMANIWNSEHKNIMHIVDYDELTSKPQETLNNIYNFLEIKPFKHDFDNIQDTLNIPSESVVGIYDFYKVNSKLEKKSVDSNKVLLPETINRYSGLEFWK